MDVYEYTYFGHSESHRVRSGAGSFWSVQARMILDKRAMDNSEFHKCRRRKHRGDISAITS